MQYIHMKRMFLLVWICRWPCGSLMTPFFSFLLSNFLSNVRSCGHLNLNSKLPRLVHNFYELLTSGHASVTPCLGSSHRGPRRSPVAGSSLLDSSTGGNRRSICTFCLAELKKPSRSAASSHFAREKISIASNSTITKTEDNYSRGKDILLLNQSVQGNAMSVNLQSGSSICLDYSEF